MLNVVSFMLISCGSAADMEDLRMQMIDIEKKPRGRIPPPPEFKAFSTFTYKSTGSRSPFVRPVEVVFETAIVQGKSVIPDLERRKEALEKISLDSMTYVGTLSKEKQASEYFAIVDDGVGGIHRVELGDYLGQDHGRIVSINARRIELLEIVPSGEVDVDGNKMWIERPRNLVLRDN